VIDREFKSWSSVIDREFKSWSEETKKYMLVFAVSPVSKQQ
jgi:hypothetical protein